METIQNPLHLQSRCRQARSEGRSIGFVPTMGFLHEGHLSLFRRARGENDVVVASIFVNPTQFGPSEDLDRYPRDEAGDARKLAAEDVEILFLPEASSLYPQGYATYVDVDTATGTLCGASRPGHFRGVATIVLKLLHLVDPTRLYLGRKDFQQTVVIRRMMRDLNFDTEVVVCPTVREPDGLAMSSRNAHLGPDERRAATALVQALRAAEKKIGDGATDAEELACFMREQVRSEPRVAKIDYLEIVDPENLQPVKKVQGVVLLAGALRIGPVRLIDNLLVGPMTRPRKTV